MYSRAPSAADAIVNKPGHVWFGVLKVPKPNLGAVSMVLQVVPRSGCGHCQLVRLLLPQLAKNQQISNPSTQGCLQTKSTQHCTRLDAWLALLLCKGEEGKVSRDGKIYVVLVRRKRRRFFAGVLVSVFLSVSAFLCPSFNYFLSLCHFLSIGP